MEKRDWIWVAIRVFGIFLLVRAVLAIPDLLSYAYQVGAEWWSIRFVPMISGTADVYTRHLMLKQSSVQLVRNLVLVIICGWSGMYLVRDGGLLFRWIFPEEADHK